MYVADGVTNSVKAITPVTLGFAARNIDLNSSRRVARHPSGLVILCVIWRLSTTTLKVRVAHCDTQQLPNVTGPLVSEVVSSCSGTDKGATEGIGP